MSNQKGVSARRPPHVNLAAALAHGGARVLVIDLDPQGNASTALGVEHQAEVHERLRRSSTKRRSQTRCSTPPSPRRSGACRHHPPLRARRSSSCPWSLENSGSGRHSTSNLSSLDEPYHYVFIDCPPSLGLLTINAFVAAQEVLIPIQTEYYALEGLSQLLRNIELIDRRHLNPNLRVSTILLTMFDGRTNLSNQVAADVREHFGDQVLKAVIPRSVRVSEAPSYGQSVVSYDVKLVRVALLPGSGSRDRSTRSAGLMAPKRNRTRTRHRCPDPHGLGPAGPPGRRLLPDRRIAGVRAVGRHDR